MAAEGDESVGGETVRGGDEVGRRWYVLAMVDAGEEGKRCVGEVWGSNVVYVINSFAGNSKVGMDLLTSPTTQNPP